MAASDEDNVVLVDGSYKQNRVCREQKRVISQNALFDRRHGSVADDCVKEIYVARCCTLGSPHFLPLELLSFHVASPLLASRCSNRIRARNGQSSSASPASPDMASPNDATRFTSHCAEYARRLYGKDLSVWIKKMPTAERVELVEKFILESAMALGHLHERHVIHGDVKVENVLMLDKHAPFVMIDFGLARMDFRDTNTAHHQQVVGTYCCRAPESVIQGVMLPASDIFALGVAVVDWIGVRSSIMVENDETASDEEYRAFMARYIRAPAQFSLGQHAILKALGRGQKHAHLVALLRDMLHFNPSKRPSATEIVTRIRQRSFAVNNDAIATAATAATTFDPASASAASASAASASSASASEPHAAAVAGVAEATSPSAAVVLRAEQTETSNTEALILSPTSNRLRPRKRRPEVEDSTASFVEAVIADVQEQCSPVLSRAAAALLLEHLTNCQTWIQSTCLRHDKPCLTTATLKLFRHALNGQPGVALITELKTIKNQSSATATKVSNTSRWFELAAFCFLFVDALVYTNTVRISRVVVHTPGMNSSEDCRSKFTRFMNLYEWDCVFTHDDFSTTTPAQWHRITKQRMMD
jgi:serine/threonine protein kinase